LVFYGEYTGDRSTVHQWVKKWSGMSVGATHNFNRQKYDKLIQENQSVSLKAITGELNIGLARAKEIIAALGYKKRVCSMRPD
jgi:hypothetical protein